MRAERTRNVSFPFGIWFANATTLYVADEGNGNVGTTVETFYDPAQAQTTAGLQKWIFDSVTSKWKMAYVLTNGLNLGITLQRPWLSDRKQFRDRRNWISLGAGNRRSSQHNRHRERGRQHRNHLCDNLDGEWKWRSRSGIPMNSSRLQTHVDATSLPPGETFTLPLRGPDNLEALRGVSFTPGS